MLNNNDDVNDDNINKITQKIPHYFSFLYIVGIILMICWLIILESKSFES